MDETQAVLEPIDRIRLNATKCRDLAQTAMTPAAREVLAGLAVQYEQQAKSIERSGAKRPRRPSAFDWPRA